MNRIYLFMTMATLTFCVTACKKSSEIIETENETFSQSASFSKTNSDSISVNFDIDFPIKAANSAVLKSVQTTLLKNLFGENYITMNISEAIASYYQELVTEYELDYEAMNSEEEHLTEFPYGFYNNEHILNAHIISTTDNIVCYCIERYLYTGGAHGINTRIFINFDMRNGNIIKDADLYIAGFETELVPLLINNLIEQNNDMQLISDLKDSDYEIDAIQPNNNFYLSEDGVTYVYNPYEIAPYALGETEIFISKEEIKPYLKPEWVLF